MFRFPSPLTLPSEKKVKEGKRNGENRDRDRPQTHRRRQKGEGKRWGHTLVLSITFSIRSLENKKKQKENQVNCNPSPILSDVVISDVYI